MIGAFVIFGDTELTMACARELNKLVPEHDRDDHRRIQGHSPHLRNGAAGGRKSRYLLARKSPKLYMRNVFSTEVRSITTGHRQILCLDGNDAEYIKGKRVVIVDDVISTGESLRALETLVEHAGGEIVGRMAILAEGEAADRDDIIYLEKLPLFKSDGTPIA